VPNFLLGRFAGGRAREARIPLPGGGWEIYTPTAVHYWHPDWLGTSRLESSSSQTVEVDAAFAPYGETYAHTGGFDLTFTGNANTDTAPDLYDFLYRRYAPVQGRWISPDRAGLAAVDMTNPQTWDRYAYVGNNPLANIDPFGLACFPRYEGDCSGGGLEGANTGNGDAGRLWNPFQLMNIPITETTWGWIPNTPDSGVSPPFNPMGSNTQVLAYWGVASVQVGAGFDLISAYCTLFCGSDGTEVFDRNYPLHPRPTTTVGPVSPPPPTPATSGWDRFSWCMTATYLRMGSGGTVPMASPADSVDQVPVGEDGTIWGPQEYNPNGNAQGAAAGNAAALVGNVGGCFGAPVP